MGNKGFGAFFLFLGLLFVGIGIALSVSEYRFMQEAEPIIARIDRIDTYKRGDDYRHDVFVIYEDNYGVENQTELNHYSSDMYEGKRITVYYNEETNEIRHKTGAIYFIFILLGSIHSTIGFSLLRKKENKQQAW